AAMPDVHWGIGATVGSVIPTKGAIIPAAVGVDTDHGRKALGEDRARYSAHIPETPLTPPTLQPLTCFVPAKGNATPALLWYVEVAPAERTVRAFVRIFVESHAKRCMAA